MFTPTATFHEIEKHDLLLDPIGYESRPPKGDDALITFRLANNPVNLSIEELAEAIQSGHAFCPATFTGNHNTIEAFKQTSLFIVDVDNECKSPLQWRDALQYLSDYGLAPAIIYTTHRHTEEVNRYRLIWQLKYSVTDIRVRNLIANTLGWLFPKGCIDRNYEQAHMRFLGGTGIVHLDPDAYLDLESLFKAVYYLVKSMPDKDNHARELRRYSETVGVNMVNGLPDIDITEHDPSEPFLMDMQNSLLYIIMSSTLPSLFTVSFSRETVHNRKSVLDRTRHIEKQSLYDSCRLYREFTDNTRYLSHSERWGIASNLIHFRGGEKLFFEALAKNHRYDYDDWKEADLPYLKKKNYAPQGCDKFCSYCEECNPRKNILMTAKGIWKGKVTVHTPPVRIPLDEAEQNFTGALDEAFNDPETHVHHIRAMVGLGKTREIIRRIVLGESFVYASPTHKLLNQVANDLRQQGFSDFVQIGELPRECFDESELFMIDLYHGLGCIGHAKKLLYDKQKQLREDVERLHTLGTIGGTEHDLAVSKYYSLRDYLKTIDEAQTH